MQFIEANRKHFSKIANLVSSPEELFLVYPSGRYPWDIQQLNKLYAVRKNFTVGIINGSIAAFANLYNIKPDDSAFIGNVIVSDAYKGQGVGKALTKYMLRLCKEKYEAVAHLSVFGFNARAIIMYSNLGFVPYAVEPRKDLKGEKVALIHMRYTSEK